MKIRKYFSLTMCLLLTSLFSCKNKEENISLPNGKENRISIMINYDYGMHIENKLTLLFDSSFPYFNIKDYGIDKVVGGDVLEITIKEDFYCEESYQKSYLISSGLYAYA